VKQRELAFAAEGDPEGGRSSCTDFLRQMGYREYSRYLSFHFPFTHERSLLEHLRACPWRFDQRLFKVCRAARDLDWVLPGLALPQSLHCVLEHRSIGGLILRTTNRHLRPSCSIAMNVIAIALCLMIAAAGGGLK